MNDLKLLFKSIVNKHKGKLSEKDIAYLSYYGEKNVEIYQKEAFPFVHKNVMNEYNVRGVTIENVPVKGIIDKIEIYGDDVTVVDYKTGSLSYTKKQLALPTEGNPAGGDYWFQMQMYALLVNRLGFVPWRAKNAVIEHIHEDSGYTRIDVEITPESQAIVIDIIKHVYKQINDKAFLSGCGECHICFLNKIING